ncbi:hypothetical protein D3C81_1763400 [compost metagenome]
MQAFARIGVGLAIGHPFQAQQAFLARRQAPVDHPVDTARQVDAGRKEDPAQNLQGTLEGRQRRLQQRRRQGAAEHDQARRAIEQRTDMPAFEEVAADNRDERQDQADQA